MKILLVDDEELQLIRLEKICKKIRPEDEYFIYTNPVKAFREVKDIKIDIAFLDIEMPGYNGVEMAKRLIGINPQINIIFVTAYDDYAIDAYKLFAKKYNYPIHIGITEAGTIKSGNIKSSIGLGILLYEGIGDTMRVSLTGDPVQEIYTAKKILENLDLRGGGIDIVSCPTCARTSIDLVKIANIVEDKLNSKKYDEMLKSSNKKKYKVAVMGCAVNGPGEAREADIGIAGGNGEAILFKKGKIIKKIKEDNIVKELLKEIDKDLNGR